MADLSVGKLTQNDINKKVFAPTLSLAPGAEALMAPPSYGSGPTDVLRSLLLYCDVDVWGFDSLGNEDHKLFIAVIKSQQHRKR
jgi:hypothetical protein